jgi:hypothetical protein
MLFDTVTGKQCEKLFQMLKAVQDVALMLNLLAELKLCVFHVLMPF